MRSKREERKRNKNQGNMDKERRERGVRDGKKMKAFQAWSRRREGQRTKIGRCKEEGMERRRK